MTAESAREAVIVVREPLADVEVVDLAENPDVVLLQPLITDFPCQMKKAGSHRDSRYEDVGRNIRVEPPGRRLVETANM
jgi:hypothetical protein